MKGAPVWLPRSHAARRQKDRRAPVRSETAAASALRQLVGGSHSAHESLVAAAIQYLTLQGFPAMPINTGPRVRPREEGGFELRANPLQKGFSDLITVFPPHGRLVLIEAKTGNARRTPEQVELQAKFRAAGALCLVIKNVLDLQPYVQEAKRLAARCSEPVDGNNHKEVRHG
jgi:hypothetical protein